ncbi:MAG: hypothetical protein IJY04_03625 [Clostridia bacterium]|nr:hypothetical protein [Clostridia bacterium]
MAMVDEEKRADLSELLSGDDADGDEKTLVCFVCTGNTCRSPMAAAVLNHLGRGKYRAISAGTSACDGDGITPNAALALKRAGIPSEKDNDYEHHRASSISYSTVMNCDRVVAMTSRHMVQLLYAFPEFAEKICVMPEEIPDPFMYGEDVYDLCLERITDGIKNLFAVGGETD